jgi:membrane protein implicated in regulation of membrane protease activity
VFLLVGIVLLVFVPYPWNLISFALCVVLFVGEVSFWNRRVRGEPERVGAETLIGRAAAVVTLCHPDGQVRIDGEIWEARCAEGADPGDSVVVTARDGLRLIVERS